MAVLLHERWVGIYSAQNTTGRRGAEPSFGYPGSLIAQRFPDQGQAAFPRAVGRVRRPQGGVWASIYLHQVCGRLLPVALTLWRGLEKYPDIWQVLLLSMWSYFVVVNISSLCNHLPFGLLSTLIRQTPGC